MLTARKGAIDSTTIMWDFNTPFTPMDRSSRQKINTETQTLNDTTDQTDLIAIYRTFWGFLGGSDSKESACNVGDLGSIPGLERCPGGGHGNPPQYSCLENPHGQRSLAGYGPWGHKESDTTEQLSTAQDIPPESSRTDILLKRTQNIPQDRPPLGSQLRTKKI